MRRDSSLVAVATGVSFVSSLARGVWASSAAAVAAADGTAAPHADEKSLFGWWALLTEGTGGAAFELLDPRWWARYIAVEFEAEPAHVIVETMCILTILYLLLWRKPAPMVQEKLSKKEEDELIAEWKPLPLCPEWEASNKTRFIVESVSGRTVLANGSTYLNFASTNFLGLADKPDIKAACRATIDKYGVGSCGPRGFYGTFDLHLEVEAAISKFMGAQECILYSDALGCVSSVIPAFAKKGDTIVVDDAANYGIQQGCMLSRSTVHYFKHGDMDDLERVLQGLAKKDKSKGTPSHRKFIVLEGVSSIYGDIAPLARVAELKAQYHYRLIVDDSLGFGVLGKQGRGSLEHAGLAMQESNASGEPTSVAGVDILCASMDHALSSVGGFCIGNHQVVDHQRLSGAGYCFSASSPPYTSTASLMTLALIDGSPQLCASLRKKATKVRRALAAVHRDLVVLGDAASIESPVVHLALKGSEAASAAKDASVLDRVVDVLREEARIVASVPEFIPADRTRAKATLRVVISDLHTEADLDKLVKAVANAANKVLNTK